MPLDNINIVQRTLLILLTIGIIYLGGYNHHFPWVLFAVFALFDLMLFAWAILPMVKAGTFRALKQANLFNKARLPLLGIYTLAMFAGILEMELGSRDHLLLVLFWVVKVAAALCLELIIVVKLLLDDVILRPKED
jgi:hypothetical protein